MARILFPQIARKWLRSRGYPSCRSLSLILILALVGGCAWSQSLVIKRVTIIDATGRAPQPDMTVVIEQDRIVAIGPWEKTHIPKNAQIIDGTGRFLIPGLWDMHVHGASDARSSWSHLLFLANGV